MTASLTINGIVFQTLPVSARMAEAILADPMMARAVWSDVYAWDAVRKLGQVLVKVTPQNAAPLPNGVVFFVPRTAPDGQIVQNEAASAKMAERLLALTEMPTVTDLVQAITEVVQLPQKRLPISSFAVLNPVASYRMRMHISFLVVQLHHDAEDVSVHLCLPSRVSFHAEIDALTDSDGYQALIRADRRIRQLVEEFPVPSKSAANAGLRRTALRRKMEELRDAIATTSAAPIRSAEAGIAVDRLRDALGRADEEWEALDA